MKEQNNPQPSLRMARLDALCDGVFAIAMTLLVLDLQVPVRQLINSDHDLFLSLISLGPKFLSYLLSFLILGIFWVGHNSQYAFINKIDRELLWINILLLLFISLIPFSTAFLGGHIRLRFAVWVYWFNLLFIGGSLLLNWEYAKKQGFIPVLKEKPNIDYVVKRRILMAQLFYFSGALVSLINTYLGLFIILGIQLSYVFTSIFDKQTHRLFRE